MSKSQMKPVAAMVLAVPAVMAHAQSSVAVYGILDLSVAYERAGAGVTKKAMESGVGSGSRLGFRGTEDLGGGLAASFTMEMGIGGDTGALQQGGLAWGRQLWVSLSTKEWSVTAGRQYSPLWQSMIFGDASGQTFWGNSNLTGINLSSASVAGDGIHGAMTRANNSVLGTYTLGGFTGRLMLAAGDETTTGAGRLINPGFTYASGPFGISASYLRQRQSAKDIPTGARPTWQKAATVGAQYDFGIAKLTMGYFTFDPSEQNLTQTSTTTLKTHSFNIGAVVPLRSSRLIAQLYSTRFDRIAGTRQGKATTLAVAYDYALSKRTSIYSSYAHVSNNASASLGIFGATSSLAASGPGQDPSVLALGLRHTF